MLIRITNHCHGGCSHCFTNSTPKGEHMSLETFKACLALTAEIGDPTLLISGGEPTDHPDVVGFLELAKQTLPKSALLLLSHGMWLEDPKFDSVKRDRILDLVTGVQVTNDERFYPRRIPMTPFPKVVYETAIRQVSPFGRALTNKLYTNRKTPLCFNFRSVTRTLNDVRQAVLMLRQRGQFCTPSINIDGSLLAGEAITCCPAGNVRDGWRALTKGTVDMRCNKCGLVDNLTDEQKRAIGEIL